MLPWTVSWSWNFFRYNAYYLNYFRLLCIWRKFDSILLFSPQLILQMWNNELNDLPPVQKASTKAKLARATSTQTQIYLKPLFRKLKSKKLPEDILDSLTIIIRHLLDRNYIMVSKIINFIRFSISLIILHPLFTKVKLRSCFFSFEKPVKIKKCVVSKTSLKWNQLRLSVSTFQFL